MQSPRLSRARARGASHESQPRLGVLAYGPIQYHTPLYQCLAKRQKVELDVLFLSDMGYHPTVDPGFGKAISWDIDLLSGYTHRFLSRAVERRSLLQRVRELARWIPSHDVIVVNGYSNPWMLLAMALSLSRGIPFLLRASSHPKGHLRGIRGRLRNLGVRAVVSASAGGLSMGLLNDDFYRRYNAHVVTFAPNSVDNARFSEPSPVCRADLLARWGLDDALPVVMFCGKVAPHKRPLDLSAAVKLLPFDVNTLFVGDGVLSEAVRSSLIPGRGAVTGFVNQSELPSYYQAADLLVLPSEAETWGLVINEAMAAGALPVVSDRVGAARDLVCGLGEVYPRGDVPELARALERALKSTEDPELRSRVREHVSRYSLELTAEGFEQAACAVTRKNRVP
jgi:glycosyltransferase involved in cell wall biosynthesis